MPFGVLTFSSSFAILSFYRKQVKKDVDMVAFQSILRNLSPVDMLLQIGSFCKSAYEKTSLDSIVLARFP